MSTWPDKISRKQWRNANARVAANLQAARDDFIERAERHEADAYLMRQMVIKIDNLVAEHFEYAETGRTVLKTGWMPPPEALAHASDDDVNEAGEDFRQTESRPRGRKGKG